MISTGVNFDPPDVTHDEVGASVGPCVVRKAPSIDAITSGEMIMRV